MASTTDNLGLRKPATSDLVSVTTDLSENYDKIDAPTYSTASATTEPVKTKVDGDAAERFALAGNGKMSWGDGTNARDTTLERDSADTLKTGFLKNKLLGARVYKTNSTTESVSPAPSDEAINFDAESWDTNSFHDNVTNNTRLTVPFAGYWRVTAQIRFASSTSGDYRRLIVRKNGTTDVIGGPMFAPINGDPTRVNVTGTIYLAANDYIQLIAMHDAASAINVEAGSDGSFECWFQIEFVGI